MAHQPQASAQTDAFILNEATLMIGPLGSVKDLTEEEHSIGLFKSLQIQNARTFTELMQGVRQDVVASVLTSDNWTFSGEGCEFSPRQLAYYLGQDGFEFSTDKVATTTITAPVAKAAATITVALATNLAVGDYITLGQMGDNNGLVFQIEAIAAMQITLDRPTVTSFAQGATVYKLNALRSNTDSCTGANYFSAKIVSQNVGCDPIVIWLPKIQITSGLTLNFGADNFMASPMEFKTLASVRGDASYADYADNGFSEFIHFSRAFAPAP